MANCATHARAHLQEIEEEIYMAYAIHSRYTESAFKFKFNPRAHSNNELREELKSWTLTKGTPLSLWAHINRSNSK